MAHRLMFWIIFIAALLLIDIYIYQAILVVTKDWSQGWKLGIRYAFWVPTVFCISAILYFVLGNPDSLSHTARSFLLTGFFAIYLSKIFGIIILFIDDLQRAVKYAAQFFYRGGSGELPGEPISRSELLSKTALVATAVPFGAMAYGVISGAQRQPNGTVTTRTLLSTGFQISTFGEDANGEIYVASYNRGTLHRVTDIAPIVRRRAVRQ